MFKNGWIPAPFGASILGLTLFAALALPASADFTVKQTTGAEHLTVRNLIGEVVIEGHGGSEFEIEVNVQGHDADPDLVDVGLVADSSDATLSVVFPLDKSRNFVYPRMGRSTSKFTFDRGDGWLNETYGRGQRKISISGRGSGLEVWADVTVRVPAGTRLRLQHGVGKITASDLETELELDSMSGSVAVSALDGSLSVDVGSGAVTVEKITGDEVVVDTGSGSVDLADCRSERISVDTGSGHVDVDSAQAKKLLIDTGSGGVTTRGIDVDSATIDTGSGAVRLELTGMGSGRFRVDTGSGGIELRLPPDASAEIRADTGSGGIRIDMNDGAEVRHHDDDTAVIVVGGGAADVQLDTGSGSIRIRD